MEINTNTFIDTYFNEEDVFYIFLLNRTNELKTTKETKSYYCNKRLFYKHYSNYKKWNKKGIDLYFSLNTFQQIENKISRKESYVKDIKSLFFDIDIEAKTIKPNIIKSLGQPTYEIQTSPNKYQLLYCLNDTNIDKETFKNISKTLTYYFKTDTTFDTARVARLPQNINNKNNFNVKYFYNKCFYSLNHFETFIANNKLLAPQKEKKKSIQKPKKVIEDFSHIKQAPNKTYLEKYNSFLLKNGNDFSAADMSFCVYLTKVKKLKNNKTIFKHFINTCPNIETRHPNIEEYFLNILTKI